MSRCAACVASAPPGGVLAALCRVQDRLRPGRRRIRGTRAMRPCHEAVPSIKCAHEVHQGRGLLAQEAGKNGGRRRGEGGRRDDGFERGDVGDEYAACVGSSGRTKDGLVVKWAMRASWTAEVHVVGPGLVMRAMAVRNWARRAKLVSNES
ncbi:hypothetical protein B0T26DRAFT_100714 [Lasiosphaeria miniovina]|uniref:Uncharacterized protein n=1 Tax=Lasiosphaeria miniovina TaxID=1954250 RepID=A0AA40DH07_9PEZI|nr:uncharacterized protein B0T26DRAFT_100714 [Lasiosphaeria miniovina]KAK0701091.1 hypothetical protein B0T26DRAFT_100714 [Lasiosphaeria miniovina]